MKKYIYAILIIGIIIIAAGCYHMPVKETFKPQEFAHQETLVMRQFPIDFVPYFTVWKTFPVDFTEFTSYKQMHEAKEYYSYQKIKLVNNLFFIRHNSVKKNYWLEEVHSEEDRLTRYVITRKKQVLGEITQVKKDEYLKYNFFYGQKNYTIEGKINRRAENNIDSFEFQIKNNDDILATIFKEYLYMTNRYDININRQFKNIEDPALVCITVFINQILKDNGYLYK